MFELISLFSVLIFLFFVATFVFVIVGIIRHSRTTGQIFTMAQRELDRKLSEQSSRPEFEKPEAKTTVECEHCGSKVPAGISCPNCGAELPS